MSVLLQCPHCNDFLQVLSSGVAIACACPGARQAEIADKARHTAWAVERVKTAIRKHSNDRKPR